MLMHTPGVRHIFGGHCQQTYGKDLQNSDETSS